nr:retrovirus-related Pol polyprotein from transposon TNT 1-94 [Tanacetum cinerariifolium]
QTPVEQIRIILQGLTEALARECQKPKRPKYAAYHKEKMQSCKQEEARFQLNAEQADWRDDTNDEPEDQELEAHYMYMVQIQEIKLCKTHEDKELDKVITLENKVKVLDNIVYKTCQSVQTMNMLNLNCKTSFAKPEFLKKAQRANPRLYEIEEMVVDLRYFNSLELEVDSLRSQLETQKTQFLNEIDRLSREYYYADNMNAILGVYTELDEVVEIILFIVDSGCSKHMTRNLKLLTNFVEKFLGFRGTNFYSITLQDTSSPNLICLMAKATSSQAWLWHHRLSHLNFDTINLLLKNDIVIGLPKLKFVKDHLCSSCELEKAKRKSFQTKTTLCSKRRYTWTHFLRSKDETPEVLIDFFELVQRGLHAQVRTVRTDKGTKF